MGNTHSLHRDHLAEYKEEGVGTTSMLFSLSSCPSFPSSFPPSIPLPLFHECGCNVTGCLTPLPPCLPHYDELHPQTVR